ncbi:M48 family metalloprotease [Piscinibacter sp. XHJ-5]|uniref:M48 family metalloprotease n=1 Tax=Piscinibacter sp. XHJ-5 TaxID=3037797 RepID=UPI002452AEB8|nr:M48 family metalloprotease [Piscinibacter sp. XHJ-5]
MRALPTLASLAALAFAAVAQAHPLVDKIVKQLEASPASCSAVPASHPERQVIEADIARFVRVAPVPEGVTFQVLDCADDGFVHQGNAIVISTRLSRLAPSQRFFILAHELGHVHLQHHAATSKFVAQAVQSARDERSARAKVQSGLAAMSHQAELDADAFAVQLMREAGVDAEQAARLFESIGEGKDNATHPSAGRRARAIRSRL